MIYVAKKQRFLFHKEEKNVPNKDWGTGLKNNKNKFDKANKRRKK